jgi:hypothetical protein
MDVACIGRSTLPDSFRRQSLVSTDLGESGSAFGWSHGFPFFRGCDKGMMALPIFTNKSRLVLNGFAFTSSNVGSNIGFVSTASPRLDERASLIGTSSNIHDVIVENREIGLDARGALSARDKSFRGVELGDSHGKDGPGGNGTSEPNTFLGVNNWVRRNSIQIKALGAGPGKQKSQVRFCPGSVHAELDEIVSKVISSKFGSGRFSVTINEIGISGSSITGIRMFADDKKPIRGKDSLFKDAEENFCCSWRRATSSGAEAT